MRWKYVKFSRGTAKKNPAMIIREYDRIINDINKSLDSFKKHKHSLQITLTRADANFISDTYKHCDIISGDKMNVDIKINFKQLKDMWTKITFKHQEELELIDKLEEVYDERSMFVNKYLK